jgi:broad specificity phosphatase PhoE
MTLILIRHSISRQDAQVSAHHWSLTEEGRARCTTLAQRIQPYQPAVLVSSEEPKAVQTAQIVADILKLPHEIEVGLHEQRRETEPFHTQAEFEARIRKLLENPSQLVYGEETGDAAYQRFQAAIDSILSRYPNQTVAAVTHGTVLSLFLARVAHIEPVSFWQNLGMPAYVVLSLPDYRVVEIASTVV